MALTKVKSGGMSLSQDTAPSSPSVGDIWFDSSTSVKAMKTWNGSAWDQMSNKFSATGGTITTSGGYKYHTFTSSGTFSAETSGSVEIQVLGGGGGGSSGDHQWAGGGGGGGYAKVTFVVNPQSYTVTVGGAGLGQTACDNANNTGTAGGNSSFSNIIGYGGGRATQVPGGVGGAGGSYATSGATSVISVSTGGSGDASSGHSSGAGGTNGGGATWGAGAAGVSNGNPGNHATGNGNGGGGGHSCQGGHRGGGNGSAGIVIVRYAV